MAFILLNMTYLWYNCAEEGEEGEEEEEEEKKRLGII